MEINNPVDEYVFGNFLDQLRARVEVDPKRIEVLEEGKYLDFVQCLSVGNTEQHAGWRVGSLSIPPLQLYIIVPNLLVTLPCLPCVLLKCAPPCFHSEASMVGSPYIHASTRVVHTFKHLPE